MSDLERYTPELIWRMGLDEEGEWVNGDASDKRIRELEEENERLRKDAERWRKHWPRIWEAYDSMLNESDNADLHAAIDAAREQGDE